MTNLEIPDVNVLLSIVSPDHVHHEVATSWFLDVDKWGTCAITENGLLRLLLNPVIAGQTVSIQQALSILKNLRTNASHTFLIDAPSLLDTALDCGGLLGHKQVTDFYLLSIAKHCGGKIVTLDKKLLRSVAETDRHLLRLL